MRNVLDSNLVKGLAIVILIYKVKPIAKRQVQLRKLLFFFLRITNRTINFGPNILINCIVSENRKEILMGMKK